MPNRFYGEVNPDYGKEAGKSKETDAPKPKGAAPKKEDGHKSGDKGGY